jgi:hypothetical protein
MENAGEVGKQTELKLYYKSLFSKSRDNQGRGDSIGKPTPHLHRGTFYNTNLFLFELNKNYFFYLDAVYKQSGPVGNRIALIKHVASHFTS